MKKNIAIVAGGDQSEVVVSKKSAAGLLTFIDTEKYNLYLVILEGNNWTAEVDGKTYPIDKNDFSFTKDAAVRKRLSPRRTWQLPALKYFFS